MRGRCACTADPLRRDITELVRLGVCPHPESPRFTAGSDEVIRHAPPPVVAFPRDQWPRAVKALATLAKPGDVGVGDVAQRLIGHLGGEAFKKLYKKLTGQECGCANRQAKLNALYPLR